MLLPGYPKSTHSFINQNFKTKAMENLPFYVYLVFGLTVLLAIALFYKATHNSKLVLAVIFFWIVLQTLLSLAGFYRAANTTLPRLPLLVLPPAVLIISLFNTKKGRAWMDRLNIKMLTILHTIRIVVELVLFWLFVHKAVPGLITFEGRNFDLLSGISAPLIYYFGFVKKKLGKPVILIWNFACLALLLNVVTYALLSAPTSFQQFAFEQPNIAIGYFPFVLLPAFLVPLVLFSHLASIRQLVSKENLYA
jgi:hypothetical protein